MGNDDEFQQPAATEPRSCLVPTLPGAGRENLVTDKENASSNLQTHRSTKTTKQRSLIAVPSSSSSSSLAGASSLLASHQNNKHFNLIPLSSINNSEPQDDGRQTKRKVLVPLPFANKRTTGTGTSSTTDAAKSLNAKKSSKASLPVPSSRRQLQFSTASTSATSTQPSTTVTEEAATSEATTAAAKAAAAAAKASSSYASNPRHRVLKYRETADSLFGITADASEEYRQLCRDIVDGHLANDATSWSRVLELAGYATSNRSQPVLLLRLHRRATSRFPLRNHSQDQLHVFSIWLAHVELLIKTGASLDECRQVFSQMQLHGVGSQKATFYLVWAKFEQNDNVIKAKEVLELGISKKAQPQQALERALVKIQSSESGKRKSSGLSLTTTADQTNSKPKSNLPKLPTSLSPRKRNSETDVSPKRRKTEAGTVEVTNSTASTLPTATATIKKEEIKADKDNISKNNMSLEEMSLVLSDSEDDNDDHKEISKNEQPKASSNAERLSKPEPTKNGQPRACSNAERFSKPESTTEVVISNNKTPPPEATTKACVSSSQRGKETLTPSSSAFTPKTRTEPKDRATRGHRHSTTSSPAMTARTKKPHSFSLLLNRDAAGSALKRPPRLLSRTPLLGRSIGKAQRVGPQQPNSNDSDSDSDDDNADDSTTMNARGKATHTETDSTTKISKVDLGYMFAWNPEERFKPVTSSSNGTTATSKPPTPTVESTNDLPPVRESSQAVINNAQSSQLSTSVTRKSNQSTDSEQTERSDHYPRSSQSNSRRGSSDRSSHSASSDAVVSPSTARIIADSNPDFLPLVSESNILKVNSVPYMKLGVVGKGGSSKVYRALTKDCNVLAIKKVKLSGMDRKAIDGFANEIALLKRLRNNPAIIQMYDSELDQKRKALFVVMEAGEVDLAHVLHQNSIKSSDGSRALDMNFIRLTWQQMLSAVHSIHEERIIHGDLKPANFLFVRGALKLIDFGIAKAIQSEDTTNIYRESQIGTLNYMSPEAILDTGSGKPGSQKMKCGRASDIWSLGCILYQMTYGRTPFASLHMIQKMQAIVNPKHKIDFPNIVDDGAIDAMKLCLQFKAQDRPPIVGKNGLLNEHCFLHSSRSFQSSTDFPI